jgi:hypothetical protein
MTTKPCLVAVSFLLAGCVTSHQGLEPVEPSYGVFSWSAQVRSLTPRLEWAADPEASRKQDLRYQVQIVDGNVVRAFKDGIRETFYVLDRPLEANKEYQWRVRPVWVADGKPAEGQWNEKGYVFFAVFVFGAGTKSYSFTTPEK